MEKHLLLIALQLEKAISVIMDMQYSNTSNSALVIFGDEDVFWGLL